MEDFFVPYTAVTHLDAHCVAVLAPHADDEVFGCGGALANLAARAVPVHVAVLSDQTAEGGASENKTVRRAESMAAAAVMGYKSPVFWGLRDGFLYTETGLADKIIQWLTETKADLLLAPSCWEMHRDHRAVAEAAIAAVIGQEGRVRLCMYEVGAPLQPNLLLDITPYREIKARAMSCFSSQLALQRYDVQVAALNQYRTYSLSRDVQAVEAFLMLTNKELVALQLDQRPKRDSLVLHQAMAATQQLNQRLAEVTASLSWRVTAPLRWLSHWVRGRNN